ncbi:MAG: VCBS repeat-containing protein [Ignavibacteria bacterium]|nr:VCBS repeat-containing protein [Ignavibacteria bacterium]
MTENIITAIYRNDLLFGFTKMNFDFINVHSGSVSWTDYDNDTKQDVFITGINSEGIVISKLYKNNGFGFNEVSTPFHSLYNSSYEFYDLDNDGDLDVLFSGQSAENKNSYISKIFINNNGIFNESANNIPSVSKGSVSWGDFDADGFPDFVMNGESKDGNRLMIMHNNHDGTFIQHSADIPGIAFGKVLWADFDNDGLLDIILTGNLQGNFNGIVKIYRNDNGNFIEVNNDLPGIINGNVAEGDYDNDFKLDIIFTGHDPVTNKNICSVYRNIVNITNDLPIEPKGLTTTFDNSIINFN